MPKNLAIFLDGTWNEPSDNTNVWRMKVMLAEQSTAGLRQLAYYDTGVGTKWYERIRGGAVGSGLSLNIREAYQWLVEHYDKDDDVYIFGFSRGAYTARSLAGVIIKCGLLYPGAPLTVAQIYERYQKGKDKTPLYEIEHIARTKERPLTADEASLLRHSRRIPIKMIGVWDTVGALGIPWTQAPIIGRGNFYFHNTNLSVLFKHAYHAVAIDEHRAPYAAALWTRYTPTPDKARPVSPPKHEPPDGLPKREPIVEQRWFVGAHCNVGGGYKDDELAQIPLAWLQAKAEGCGLAFRNRAQLSGQEHLCKPRDSFAEFLKGVYRVARFYNRFHRTIGADARDVKGGTAKPVNETIDASVLRRYQACPDYRPKNLEEWAKRKSKDLATLARNQQA